MDSRIIIADPDDDLRLELSETLRLVGYDCRAIADGRELLRLVPAWRPRLVILELQLADLGGIEVVRRLKEDPLTDRVALVMTAHQAEEVDRVVAFTLGVDDFVLKPFSLREMALRCQAILRRVDRAAHDEHLGPMSFAELRVDRDAHRVWVTGQEVGLTHLEFRLLVTLMTRRDRVQSRDRLLQDVWGVTADVTTRTVDTHIRRLRRKLGPAGRYVETVRGVGYRFVGGAGS